MNKKNVVGISLVVLLAVVIGLVYIFMKDSEPDCCPSEDVTPTVQSMKGTDNMLEFTLTEVTCGIERIGDNIIFIEPEGQFCTGFVQVKNNSTEDFRLFSTDQKVVTSDGQEFSANAENQYYVTNGYWYENIPAEDFASGTFIWDIPVDSGIAQFKFQESVNSEGVIIQR